MLKQSDLERKMLKTFPPEGEGLYPAPWKLMIPVGSKKVDTFSALHLSQATVFVGFRGFKGSPRARYTP